MELGWAMRPEWYTQITVMSNITKSNIVLFVLVLIALGMSASAMQNTNSASPQTALNTKSIVDIDTALYAIANSQEETFEMLTALQNVTKMNTAIAESKMSAEDIANFNLRITENEKAVQTLSTKKVIATVPQELPNKTFDLAIVNVKSVPQEIFTMNEVVYVTGDSKGTDATTVTIKIRDSLGQVLKSSDFGIPNEGRFTTIWQVPNVNAGIYTVTISDGKIVESISFEVQ